MVNIQQVSYAGWDCIRLDNGIVELIIPMEIGPRIIRFAFIGRDNQFCEVAEEAGQKGGDSFHLYGGHRFWIAPEHINRTYFPDNRPIDIEEKTDLIRLLPLSEENTGIQKAIDIYLSPDKAEVKIVHRLTNLNIWDIECALWGLSVMAAGGKAILPLPKRRPHSEDLLPGNTLSLWAYTDMTDPRWTWGREYILLAQDKTATTPQKIGAHLRAGWLGHVGQNGDLFIKRLPYIEGATYPDLNCNAELYTNDFMLEVESLGPLQIIPAGASVEHIEYWNLFEAIDQPHTDADVKRDVLPHVQSLQGDD
ncbi:hypothetical protein MASR2M15_22360 [Anaerolineales bacterium]